jgi:hypothetical protein
VHVDVKIRSNTYIQILSEQISNLKSEYDYNISRKKSQRYMLPHSFGKELHEEINME